MSPAVAALGRARARGVVLPWVAVSSRQAGPCAVDAEARQRWEPPRGRQQPEACLPRKRGEEPRAPGSLPCPLLCDVHTPGKGDVATGVWAAGGSRSVSRGSEVPTCPRTSVSMHTSPGVRVHARVWCRCARVCGVRDLGRVSAGLASSGPSPPGQCASLLPGGVRPTHLAEGDVRPPPGHSDCGEVGAPGAVCGAISRCRWWRGGAPPGPSLLSDPQLCSMTACRAQGRSRGALSRPPAPPLQLPGCWPSQDVPCWDSPHTTGLLCPVHPSPQPAAQAGPQCALGIPGTRRDPYSDCQGCRARGGAVAVSAEQRGPRGPGWAPAQRPCTQSCWL